MQKSMHLRSYLKKEFAAIIIMFWALASRFLGVFLVWAGIDVGTAGSSQIVYKYSTPVCDPPHHMQHVYCPIMSC